MAALVELTVNGRPVTAKTEHGETLLELLRRELRLFSVREACGLGICGSCTVVLDGRLSSACLVLALAANGSSVETVEGLRNGADLHPLQQAFADRTAFQCSYCTPGFVLSARALLAEERRPTPEQVRDYLAGNLCRCGSYLKIEEAVLDAAARLGSETP